MRGKPANALRTALMVNEQNLRDIKRFLLLEGTWQAAVVGRHPGLIPAVPHVDA